MIVRLGRYTVIYLATLAALLVIGLVMTMRLEMAPPSGLSVLLPPLVGAIIEGQRLARSEIEKIVVADAWRAAGAMTVIALVVDAAVLVVAQFLPGPREILIALSPAFFVFSGITLALLVLLANRYGLTFAFNNERKRKTGR